MGLWVVMRLAFLILLAALFPGAPEQILLRSGQAIPVRGEVREDGNRLVFVTPSGRLYSIPIEEVDLEAMARAAEPKTPEDGAADGESPETAAEPPARREIRVSEEEKRRLLEELSRNRGGKAAPVPKSLTPEGLEEELERSARKREADEVQAERWRERARARREALTMARENLAALQARERRLQDEILTLSSMGYGGDQMSAQILQLELARSQMDGAREAIGAAERAWADLQEDARRAGALPGWLR
ncbi:MAG: hypothetical protein ABR517_14760 [Thermoanaerobaculia bacterium]